MATDTIRKQKIDEITGLYKQEGLRIPSNRYEICSAIMNGDSYAIYEEDTMGSQPGQFKQTVHLTKNNTEAHILCNQLCHKLYKERDIIINQKLMDSQS